MEDPGSQLFVALGSLIAVLVGGFVLVKFSNLCNRVSQIRDDHHALRLMIEEELKRAARDRYASTHQPAA